MWDVKREPKNAFHPTQKPVELCERAMSNHSVGKVLDLFAGSGSTLIACEKNNKTCFTIDFEPKYCDVIIKRWQDFTGKEAVLESSGDKFNDMFINGRDGSKAAV